MMGAVRKFEFETVFAADGAVLRTAEGAKSQYTQDELDAACAQARQEGEQSATAAAQAALAAAAADAASSLKTLIARLDAESAQLKRDAVDLSLAAARTAAGAALDAYPAETVQNLFAETSDLLRAAPRVSIAVGADVMDEVCAALKNAATAEGVDPEALVFQTVAEGRPGDCAISWEQGAVDRSADVILADLRAAAVRWLLAETGDAPPQLDLFDALEGAAK